MFEEVLPTIRKTGSYSIPHITPTANRALAIIENGKIVHLQDISDHSVIPTQPLGTIR